MNLLRERMPALGELAPRHLRHGIRVVALASGLHRVVLGSGEVLGYLDPREPSEPGARFRHPNIPTKHVRSASDDASTAYMAGLSVTCCSTTSSAVHTAH